MNKKTKNGKNKELLQQMATDEKIHAETWRN